MKLPVTFFFSSSSVSVKITKYVRDRTPAGDEKKSVSTIRVYVYRNVMFIRNVNNAFRSHGRREKRPSRWHISWAISIRLRVRNTIYTSYTVLGYFISAVDAKHSDDIIIISL